MMILIPKRKREKIQKIISRVKFVTVVVTL